MYRQLSTDDKEAALKEISDYFELENAVNVTLRKDRDLYVIEVSAPEDEPPIS